MQIEIINTGTELLWGSVLNTHHQWLAQQLAALGLKIARQVTVADTADAIQTAVREACARSRLVIATGGLGPTSDDRTRELVADLFGLRLLVHQPSLDNLHHFFQVRGRTPPANTHVQALVPEGATVLANHHGTAPGLILRAVQSRFGGRAEPVHLVLLPGPPRELRPMFAEQVLPYLTEQGLASELTTAAILRTTGLGESLVEARIAPALARLTEQGLEIGYCARIGEVDVRLMAQGPAAAALVQEAQQIAQAALGSLIFSVTAESLEATLVAALATSRSSLAVAESCTGGYLAHRLTNVPGASAVFLGGVVAYSNAAKIEFLNVKPQTLEAHGAVSAETAREMAIGVQQRFQSSHALSLTGIAGPTGGSPEKPVGTVFIGLATPDGAAATEVLGAVYPYDRETFKFAATQKALDLLRAKLVPG